jgi:hypothetical protein
MTLRNKLLVNRNLDFKDNYLLEQLIRLEEEK